MTARVQRQQERDGLGQRITKFRNSLGLSQQQAAERFGVGRSTWIRYETQNRVPKEPVLVYLAQAGLNINWLFEGDGPMLLEGEQAAAHATLIAARMTGDDRAAADQGHRVAEVAGHYGALASEDRLHVMLEEVIDRLGWRPPELVVYAIEQALYKGDMTLDGARAILRALKRTDSGSTA